MDLRLTPDHKMPVKPRLAASPNAVDLGFVGDDGKPIWVTMSTAEATQLSDALSTFAEWSAE
jgi:hypothetical protein